MSETLHALSKSKGQITAPGSRRQHPPRDAQGPEQALPAAAAAGAAAERPCAARLPADEPVNQAIPPEDHGRHGIGALCRRVDSQQRTEGPEKARQGLQPSPAAKRRTTSHLLLNSVCMQVCMQVNRRALIFRIAATMTVCVSRRHACLCGSLSSLAVKCQLACLPPVSAHSTAHTHQAAAKDCKAGCAASASKH